MRIKTTIERLPWPIPKPLRVSKKRGASCWGWSPSLSIRKIKQKLLKCKRTIEIATFNVRTLNRIGQLPELTASAIDHHIDIICIQEHGYTHNEYIKYHDTGNGWTLTTASVWKNAANATIGGVGMGALKSLNCIEKKTTEDECSYF